MGYKSITSDIIDNKSSKGAITETSILDLKNSIKTPGPLKVLDKVITGNIDSTTLQKTKVIEWTNINRMEVSGLKPLVENSNLNISAQKKVADMFAKQYFEHDSPTGVGVGDLGDKVGYEYIIIGENLALGNFKDEKSLLDAWMASPGHKANILNTHYTEIGVAVGHGKFNGQDTWLAVQHFGLPRSACPSIDKILKGKIELEQITLAKMSEDLAKRRTQISQGGIYDGMTNNEQIKAYNDLVVKYNELVKEGKINITKYNNQVRAFNNCIAESQAN